MHNIGKKLVQSLIFISVALMCVPPPSWMYFLWEGHAKHETVKRVQRSSSFKRFFLLKVNLDWIWTRRPYDVFGEMNRGTHRICDDS